MRQICKSTKSLSFSSSSLRCPSSCSPSSVQFKDQVVREAVEKICREFSGQCCIHKPLGGGGGATGGVGGGVGGGRGEAVGGAEAQQVPEVSSSTLPGAPSSSTPPCSSCRGQTTGGGYQCRFVLLAAFWLTHNFPRRRQHSVTMTTKACSFITDYVFLPCCFLWVTVPLQSQV